MSGSQSISSNTNLSRSTSNNFDIDNTTTTTTTTTTTPTKLAETETAKEGFFGRIANWFKSFSLQKVASDIKANVVAIFTSIGNGINSLRGRKVEDLTNKKNKNRMTNSIKSPLNSSSEDQSRGNETATPLNSTTSNAAIKKQESAQKEQAPKSPATAVDLPPLPTSKPDSSPIRRHVQFLNQNFILELDKDYHLPSTRVPRQQHTWQLF